MNQQVEMRGGKVSAFGCAPHTVSGGLLVQAERLQVAEAPLAHLQPERVSSRESLPEAVSSARGKPLSLWALL